MLTDEELNRLLQGWKLDRSDVYMPSDAVTDLIHAIREAERGKGISPNPDVDYRDTVSTPMTNPSDHPIFQPKTYDEWKREWKSKEQPK